MTVAKEKLDHEKTDNSCLHRVLAFRRQGHEQGGESDSDVQPLPLGPLVSEVNT